MAKKTTAMDTWRAENSDRISGIAKANNVDLGTAESMLISNITKGTNYAGGGVANMSDLANSYTDAVNKDQVARLEKSSSGSSSSGSSSANDYYQQIYDTQKKAIEDQLQNTLNKIDSYKTTAKADYDAQQKANYIEQQKSLRGLNDYMAAMGINGGAAETTLQNLNTNYMNNRATADKNYNDTINSINQMYADAQTEGNTELANLAQSLYETYAKQAQTDAANELALQQWQAEYDQTQANNEYSKKLQAAQLAAQYGDYSLLNNLIGTSIGTGTYGKSTNSSSGTVGNTTGTTVGNTAVNTVSDTVETPVSQSKYNTIAKNLYKLVGNDYLKAREFLAQNSNYSTDDIAQILKAYYAL